MHTVSRLTSLALLTLALAACQDSQPAADANSTAPAAPAAPVVDGAVADGTAPVAASAAVEPWTGEWAKVSRYESCALDAINGAPAQAAEFTASSAETITFEGWFLSPLRTAPDAFWIFLKGPTSFRIGAATGVDRQDVAAALGEGVPTNAGFQTTVAAGGLQPGRYEIHLGLDSADGEFICETKHTLTVVQG